MKTSPCSIARSRAGSAIPTVLVAGAVLGVVLVAYLAMLQHSNYNVVRSQVWNQAVPVIEAGVEDALTHLNVNSTTNNFACDGWSRVGSTSMYTVQRTIGGNTYHVVISNFFAGSMTNDPSIEARAFVRLPGTYTSLPNPGSGPFFFAAVGANQIPSGYIVRGVKLTAAKRPAFPGLIARKTIQIQNDGGVMINSYDSTDSNHSDDGVYDPSESKPNGFIATNSRDSQTMQVSGPDTKIVGRVGTGASGVLKINSPARIGSWGFCNNSFNNGKIQDGYLNTRFNFPTPDVVAPTGSPFSPSGRSVDGVSYDLVLDTGLYRVSKIDWDNNKKMLVTGVASLIVVEDFKLKDSDIIIAPGAKLSLYVTKAFSMEGTAKINRYGTPEQFLYYGLPDCQSVQVRDTCVIVGVMYAPQADAQFQHNSVLCGAGLFDDIQLQHYFKFHFDEALNPNNNNIYQVMTWNEMTPAQVSGTPPGVTITPP